jgi:hypothetical protein
MVQHHPANFRRRVSSSGLFRIDQQKRAAHRRVYSEYSRV